MSVLYIHEHEGVWFSKNGHRAYLAGEKPRFMWPAEAKLERTADHHIQREVHNTGGKRGKIRLVTFYRLADRPIPHKTAPLTPEQAAYALREAGK